MRILITGGAGLIGSHLCDALLQKNHEVVCVDDLSKGSEKNIQEALENKRFQFLKADICDPTFKENYKKETDVVVHLAAAKIPRYGNRLATLTTNGFGSFHVFDLAQQLKSKLVFASTSDVYGKNDKVPLSEEENPIFTNPSITRWAYAVSKYFEEHLAFAMSEKYGISIVCLRFFATYGPRMHLSWSAGPTPVFIEKAYHKETIPIHGDGKQTRCFCYVSDTVEGLVRSIEMREADNHIFNLGNPKMISILDYAEKIQQIVCPDTPSKIEFIPYETFGKYEDIKQRVPDISKAQKILGFEPKVSFDEGLKQTVKWQLSFYD